MIGQLAEIRIQYVRKAYLVLKQTTLQNTILSIDPEQHKLTYKNKTVYLFKYVQTETFTAEWLRHKLW